MRRSGGYLCRGAARATASCSATTGFHPRELTGIYFGPKCAEQDREDLLKLLGHGLEHVKVYQMHFDTKQARLVARPLER